MLACADNGLYMDGLHWSGWGKPIAHATGVINVHGCNPDCADDNKIYTFAVTVTAHQIVTCPSGRRQYAFISYAVTPGPNEAEQPSDGDRGYDC